MPFFLRASGLLLALAWSADASAASFDCKHARRPMEIAVCANAQLSQLDEQLAREYGRALRVLSAPARASLQASQRSWLRYVNLVCRPAVTQDQQGREEYDACLQEELERRAGQLVAAGVRAGPFLFTRVDLYDAVPVKGDDRTGHRPGFALRHIGYPQIDAPDAAAAEWNRQQARSLQPEDPKEPDATDYATEYFVTCAAPDFLSLRQVETVYAHGTPHGDYSYAALTFRLAPALRRLRADDLFAPDSRWQSRVPALFWTAYLRDQDGDPENTQMKAAIRSAAANVQRWVLTPEGLQVGFDAYEGGSYAGTPGPVTVRWAALRPLLAGGRAPACTSPRAMGR